MKSEKKSADLFVVIKNLLAILVIALIVTVVASSLWRGKEIDKNAGDSGGSDIKPVPVQEKIITPKVIYNLSGRITKIDGNTIIFNAEIYGVDEKGERSMREEKRMAIVNSRTKLSSLSFVDRSPVEKDLNIADLKAGNYVEIISVSDISKAEEFLATQIRVKSSL